MNTFTEVKISLARPHDIRSWSFGEVKKPETINHRTYRPEKDGLFCERIFGPEKDWECSCGKYRGVKYKGMICDRCGVKITHGRVRRKRMGHIELAAPVVHIWFFKAMPSRLGALLAMKTTSLEKVIYFLDYVVTRAGDTDLKPQQLLTEDEYREKRKQYGEGSFDAEMGAEAVRKLLMELDLVKLSQELRGDLAETSSKQKKNDLINRLKIVEAIRDSDNRPEWMVLDVIPVIPPDLRPLVRSEVDNLGSPNLNELYCSIIEQNSRVKELLGLTDETRDEKRLLQQSVDALFESVWWKNHLTEQDLAGGSVAKRSPLARNIVVLVAIGGTASFFSSRTTDSVSHNEKPVPTRAATRGSNAEAVAGEKARQKEAQEREQREQDLRQQEAERERQQQEAERERQRKDEEASQAQLRKAQKQRQLDELKVQEDSEIATLGKEIEDTRRKLAAKEQSYLRTRALLLRGGQANFGGSRAQPLFRSPEGAVQSALQEVDRNWQEESRAMQSKIRAAEEQLETVHSRYQLLREQVLLAP